MGKTEIYGKIYLKPTCGIKCLNETWLSYDEQNNINVEGEIEDITGLEDFLILMKKEIRGLGIECSAVRNGTEMNWLYTMENGKLCRQNGFLFYKRNVISEKQGETIRKALEEYGNCDEGEKERIMDKIYNMNAVLESVEIGEERNG